MNSIYMVVSPFDKPSIDDVVLLQRIADRLNTLPIDDVFKNGKETPALQLPVVLEVGISTMQPKTGVVRLGYSLLNGYCDIIRESRTNYTFIFPVQDLYAQRVTVYAEQWAVQHNALVASEKYDSKHRKTESEIKLRIYGSPQKDFLL